MAQLCCDADDAFGHLTTPSQHSNRKLRDIAQSIVDSITASQPASTRSNGKDRVSVAPTGNGHRPRPPGRSVSLPGA